MFRWQWKKYRKGLELGWNILGNGYINIDYTDKFQVWLSIWKLNVQWNYK